MATDPDTIALRKANAKAKAARRREAIHAALGRADEGDTPRDAGGIPRSKPRPTTRPPRKGLRKGAAIATAQMRANRAKSTASEDVEETEDTEETTSGGGIGRPGVPDSVRRIATERRRDKPTNYKLHVITAMSLALTVRIMSQRQTRADFS